MIEIRCQGILLTTSIILSELRNGKFVSEKGFLCPKVEEKKSTIFVSSTQKPVLAVGSDKVSPT